MDIVLYIVLGLAVLVTAVLLIPIKVMLKNDENNVFHVKLNVLFKTFTILPAPPKTKPVKAKKKPKATPKRNLDRFHKTIQKDGLIATVSDTVELLKTALGEIFNVVRHVHITKLQMQIVCVGRDAADAAIQYGRCCALVYPLAGFVHSLTTVNPKHERIDVRCDFLGDQETLRYDVHLSVRVSHLVAAILRFVWKESSRMVPTETASSK